jgi:hypothetical protein
MLEALLTTLLITAGLAVSLRDRLITRHSYNNRYSDAPGAREDHLG